MADLNKKCFANKYCSECIAKNIAKYGSFDIECNGITVDKDVKYAISQGVDEHDAKWMYDPRYFFTKVYGKKPRWYQEPILLCTSKNLVSRQCRQSGKTLAIIFKIMHFLVTNDNETVLVITPNESQVKKIFEEYVLRDCINKSTELKESVTSRSQKPYYKVELCNSSKIQLMIAGDTVRGQSGSWIYIDEAALIGSELLNSILMTVAAKGDEAVIIQTSTPKGRGNQFYKACKEYTTYNEYHVSIHQIDEMKSLIPSFRRQLGETGFLQEAEAEFPDISGGPFNYAGIDASKSDYRYDECERQEGVIYIGGVDWNGPTIGSYFYVISFNPETYEIKIVDKSIVSSANWNSLVAKEELISLNRKWQCKHWMVDYGYSSSIVEELRSYSMKIASSVGNKHPDAQIKYTLETVEFGSFLTTFDPFTKEEIKKTTKAFIISQTSRLFEPDNNGMVAIQISVEDDELIKALENYKLLNVTARGFEQYGFDKGAGVEDHILDALNLAIYGVVKYYNELFKRVVYHAVTIGMSNKVLTNALGNNNDIIDARGRDILLLSDNDKSTIQNDDKYGSLREQRELNQGNTISRTFSRSGTNLRSMGGINPVRARSHIIKRTLG
jgi:hypothetical protein